MISFVLAIATGLLVIAADQISKWLVASNMVLGYGSKDFIKGFIEFTYIHNDGGAWGFMSGNTWILISVTVLAMLICLALLLRHGIENKLLFWSMILVLAGGIGNLIDRIFRGGKVIDFLNFEFMDFPVFNIADVSVCVGVGLLALYFIIDIIKDVRSRRVLMEEKDDGKL